MTSIRAYDPARAGAALPELPPIPIGAVAVGAADLLQQAADLPAPTSITLYDHESITLHVARHQDGIRAITGWARRFGSVTTSRPGQIESVTGTWHTTDFDYYGIAVQTSPLQRSQNRHLLWWCGSSGGGSGGGSTKGMCSSGPMGRCRPPPGHKSGAAEYPVKMATAQLPHCFQAPCA